MSPPAKPYPSPLWRSTSILRNSSGSAPNPQAKLAKIPATRDFKMISAGISLLLLIKHANVVYSNKKSKRFSIIWKY
ncbi:MAG: hypothetical protein AMJ53_00240 [Gammaproteobacteria bacterium SG8_11]|nr:MAG: hypothetical protein AMJ53_00240 [Gammaproteobacteria bacterium SG8_11]